MCSAVKFFYVSLFQTYNIIAKESSYYLYIFKETVHDHVKWRTLARQVRFIMVPFSSMRRIALIFIMNSLNSIGVSAKEIRKLWYK